MLINDSKLLIANSLMIQEIGLVKLNQDLTNLQSLDFRKNLTSDVTFHAFSSLFHNDFARTALNVDI